MNAPLSPKQIEARLPVWRALSDLFLDTALQDYNYKYVADVVFESDFEPAEMQCILWKEVFPALADNLRIATGEWGAFEESWLQQRITNVLSGKERGCGNYGLISVNAVRAIIEDAWTEVCRYLPSDYKNAADGNRQGV